MATSVDSSQPPTGKTKLGCARSLGWICLIVGSVTTIALILIFRLVGDLTPFGEAVTAFPPVIYLFPLILMFLPVLFTRSWLAGVQAILCMAAFILITEDWLSLTRIYRPSDTVGNIRVITLNIDSRSDWTTLLDELEPYRPDILFLQETLDGSHSLTTQSLTGYWKGFSYHDQGDCAIVSRYPMRPIESRKIGPWDKPALARIAIAGNQYEPVLSGSVLLCNVRLMLPAVATSPDLWLKDYSTWPESHRIRIHQFRELATLLESNIKPADSVDDSIILAGDFNTRGGSKSLKPLEDMGMDDAWSDAGTGWGGTIITSFPVARIDQIWTSRKFRPIVSHTVKIRNTDHRAVLTVLTK